jgi:hypothetical protein
MSLISPRRSQIVSSSPHLLPTMSRKDATPDCRHNQNTRAQHTHSSVAPTAHLVARSYLPKSARTSRTRTTIRALLNVPRKDPSGSDHRAHCKQCPQRSLTLSSRQSQTVRPRSSNAQPTVPKMPLWFRCDEVKLTCRRHPCIPRCLHGMHRPIDLIVGTNVRDTRPHP